MVNPTNASAPVSAPASVSAPAPSAGEKVLGSLVIARCYEGSGGVQLILDHSSAKDLLEAVGLGENTGEEGEETFTPITVRRDAALALTVRTPKGKVGTLVWGDTHALHQSHQSDSEFFSLLLGAARSSAFEVEVTKVENYSIKKSRGGKAKTVALSKDAV